MKRKITLLLSAAVASSCFSGTVYGASFRDIGDVPWSGAGAAINSAAELGLLNGYEDGTFRARNNVTYCEAAQMLYTTLLKTGMAEPLQAVDSYRYTSFLNTYRIPKWAHISVAYCLEKGILTTADIMKFTTDGKSNPATREDVAKMFGNALAVRYDVDGKSASAAEFADYWRISTDAMPLVDLLKRLGIVSGDNYHSFRPKESINRAEMAVMLNKTYGVLTQGIGSTGTVTDVAQNDGTYFYFEIEMDVTGYKEGYRAMTGNVKAYGGEGNNEISLSRISKGDRVSIVRNGDSLTSIRLLSAVSDQEKYDVTGYIMEFRSNLLSLENENTGDIDRYSIGAGCICYLDGKKVTKKELQDIYKERADEHAYVGLMIGTQREKVSYEDDGKKSTMQNVEVAEEMYVTFSDDYTMSGEVKSLTKSRLSYATIASGTERILSYAPDCEYYIGSRKATMDDMVEMADSGTTYVRVTVDKTEKAVKVVLSEEPFSSRTNEATANKIFDLLGFSDKKIIIKDTGEKVTYNFGSSNPVSNITFYTWDDKKDEWSKTSFKSADKYYDDAKDDKIYCSMEFNSGGKIKTVYMAYKKAAWRESGDQTERKGVVESVSGNTLRFKTATTSYTLLKQYNANVKEDDGDKKGKDNSIYIGPDANGREVRNPLIITSAVTSSRTVFEKMANSDDVELYAEILADAANNVIKIDARLTKAEGTLVEYERHGDGGTDKNPKPTRYITIETSDGAKLTLNIVNTPRLGCEDDEYTLDDLESTTYVGSLIELGFNSSGEVNKITVLEASNRGKKIVKGTAVSGTDGLKIKGDSKVYPWLGLRKVAITHKSMDSTSLDKLIELLDDSDTTVYVSARLDEKERVESITVQVEAASGVLQEYDEDDDLVRIKTDDGHTLSFRVVPKPKCDVDGVKDYQKLDDKCRGTYVDLTFNTDGYVSEITD